MTQALTMTVEEVILVRRGDDFCERVATHPSRLLGAPKSPPRRTQVASSALGGDVDLVAEGDKVRIVLAHALAGGWDRIRVRPSPVGAPGHAAPNIEVLTIALPWTVIGRVTLLKHRCGNALRREIPIAFDPDQVTLGGLGDDNAAQQSLHSCSFRAVRFAALAAISSESIFFATSGVGAVPP